MGQELVVALRASDAAIHEVDERYLSFTIDLGQIAEPTRFWNPDGSGETTGRPTFDFASKRMHNMAAALAPAFLRIGGTEADRVLYALDGAVPETPPPPFKSVLSAAHVDALGNFALQTGLHVSFTVNAGWGARTAAGVWGSTQTRALMRYVAEHKYPFTVWELGNEPNAWPLFQKNLVVEPEDYARDLVELAAARDAELPAARIAGPSTAYWPIIGEVRRSRPSPVQACALSPVPSHSAYLHAWQVPAFPWEFPPRLISDYLPRVLRAAPSYVVPDVVTWHYYPGLSTRSALAKHRPEAASIASAVALVLVGLFASRRLISLRALLSLLLLTLAAGSFAVALNRVVRPVKSTGPGSLRDPLVLDTVAHWGSQVESQLASLPRGTQLWLGETGSAQVGGEPNVSGRWATALWWLDQLGLLATLNHSVQCRQTLSGADYGLIDDATFEPTPDYWASVLWRRLMGSQVLRAEVVGAPATLRVYAHRSKSRAGAPADASSTEHRSVTYLVINTGSTPATIDLGPGGGTAELWLLEGPSLDAHTCTINGVQAATAPDGTVPDFAPRREGRPRLPPGSAMFVRVQ